MKSLLPILFILVSLSAYSQKCIKVETLLTTKQVISMETTISKLKLTRNGQREIVGTVTCPVFVSPEGDEYIFKLQNKKLIFEKIDGYYLFP